MNNQTIQDSDYDAEANTYEGNPLISIQDIPGELSIQLSKRALLRTYCDLQNEILELESMLMIYDRYRDITKNNTFCLNGKERKLFIYTEETDPITSMALMLAGENATKETLFRNQFKQRLEREKRLQAKFAEYGMEVPKFIID